MHATVPRIDFQREMLVAVALGATSGCDNVKHNVGRILEYKNSIVVYPPSGLFEPRETCMMTIEPVDVVRVPRSDKRIVFDAKQIRRPLPPATWWWSPSPAEFEAADSSTQAAFAVALSRDPATPFATVEALARYEVVHPTFHESLVTLRPEVRASVPLLTMLTRSPSSASDSAVAILLRDFGAQVAGDSLTPRDVLIKFIRHLGSRTGEPHDIASRLLKNPTVVADSELVVTMVDYVGDRELRGDACRIYLAHWTNWQRAYNPDGTFIGWNSRVSCPNMPPHPSS